VWLYRIGAEVEKDSANWHFWTLTLDGRDHDGDAVHSIRRWRQSWDSLMKRTRRALGKMRYLRVFETHKDGTLHVHMLADATFPDVQRVIESDGRDNYRSNALRGHLTDLGLGWRHDLRPLQHRYENTRYASAVAGYLGKYLTKGRQGPLRDLFHAAGEKRVRMLQTSRGWAKLDADASSGASWQPTRGITKHMWMWRHHVDGVETVDLDARDVLTEVHFYAGRWPQPSEDVELGLTPMV
jgi:hypothetical protein